MDKWHETSGDDLLEAHAIMMKGLLTDAGQWRNGGAGIYLGDQLVHIQLERKNLSI